MPSKAKCPPLVTGLREEYLALGVPRHPKKGVASQRKAEVQGAVVDGEAGLAYPKPEKLLKYAQLGAPSAKISPLHPKAGASGRGRLCLLLHVSKTTVGVLECIVAVYHKF